MAIDFTEVRPTLALLDTSQYASVDDLLQQDDLLEQDVTIRRWQKNGKALKLRIKALNLEQQDAIYMASLVQNKKTKLWEQDREAFCAESLLRLVRVPALDLAMAKQLVRKNPVIINALVDFGWSLAALDSADLEAAAHALLPPADPNESTSGDSSHAPGAA